MKIRIALADDHIPFRQALRNMLARDADMDVVGEAGDGNAALDLVQTTLPDVVVMDIRMPGFSGIAALRQLAATHPGVKVIVLSVTSESFFAAEMLRAGASGYVTKADAEELPRAIRAAQSGANYLSAEVASTTTTPACAGLNLQPSKP